MRKTMVTASILIITLLGILSLAQRAHAATIYTAKEDGTVTSIFEINENVRLVAQSMNAPSEIKVIDPEGVTRYQETVHSVSQSYDKVLSSISDIPGWWKVEVHAIEEWKPLAPTQPEKVSTQYLISVNNVVSEVPVGTLSALLMFFAAFGIIILGKRTRSRLS